MKKRILSAVLVSGVTLGTASVQVNHVNADDFDSQIAAADAVINNLTNAQAEAQNKVAVIQGQVSTLEAQQTELANENARLESVSQQLNDEIQALSNKIVARNDAIKKQARNAQKEQGKSSYLGSILNSKSVSEAISRIVAINKVVSANEKLLNQQEADKAALEQKQAENQEAMNTIAANQAAIEENKNTLATQQAELEAAQVELQAQLSTAQEQKASIVAQKAAAEEAARKAAEAEAAAKAKAEAEAKAQEQAKAESESAAAQAASSESAATSEEAASESAVASETETTQSQPQQATESASETVTPEPVAKTTTQAVQQPAAKTTVAQSVDTTNTYPVGQCTWGVKSMASWVGNYWGNARDWIASAQSAGHSVGTTPAVGAVAVWPTDGGGYGHVAYVTNVDSNTSIQVMESNYAGNMSIGNYRGTFNPTTSPVYYIYQ